MAQKTKIVVNMTIEDNIKARIETLKEQFNLLNTEINELSIKSQEMNNKIINKKIEITSIDKAVKELEAVL